MDQLIEYPTDKEIQLQRYIQSLHQELQVSHQTKLSLQEALAEANKQGTYVHFIMQCVYIPKLAILKELKQKGAISPEMERPCPPKLVCVHFASTSICMNFLRQFYFLTSIVRRENFS